MIRAAIVGLGWWGRVMVDSVQFKSSKLRFICAAALDRAAVEQFADDRGIAVLGSLAEILERADIDAVFLATPHSLHLPQIIECAGAGKPVFSEKPLALTLLDAQDAVRACQRANVPLGIGTDRRMLPAMLRLKRLLGEGKLGEILHVEGQYSNDFMSRAVSGSWRSLEKETPGAGMTGPGLHVLDAMIHLAGPIATVRGQVSRPKGRSVPIDAVSLLVKFVAGATGTLGCVRGVPNYFRLAVFGTAGWAELRQFGDLEVSIGGQPTWLERYPGDLAVGVGSLLEAFADSICGSAEFPVTTRSMLQVVAAFETTVNALESGSLLQVPKVA
jgi:predicted dehydrogenase